MGYSLSARFKTRAERDAMLAFVEKQDWSVLHASVRSTAYHTTPVGGEDLGYPPRGAPDRLVGFDFTLTPYYAWAVCAWMATKSSFRSKGQAVMYLDDKPMIVEQGDRLHPQNTTRTLVDDRGIVIPPAQSLSVLRVAAQLLGGANEQSRANQKRLHAWLTALDGNWEEQKALGAPAPLSTTLPRHRSKTP